ncbi:hypothetical protein [Psychroserpens sp.]|uniref:hypothetical protein n=1 Tax=Psychroserpens sp. TaxID=2020870 RepID=UPI001B274A1F|nr:hypothetical protein [Psychroserpens sp.]MBO6605633.1 hypothetical protein [Psychroserpens sp.]MBO6631827.1 hypothetical protein [Psychroserpens sp.]MBO6653558.1 hypothetical protein [Psychroserpens sp.]MBO6681879.1 hypothetical protein [Psychroserpens sp.]MBO6749007.1 hypothetical protein [Psychroserpens sp.]
MFKKVVAILVVAIGISVFLVSIHEDRFDETRWQNDPFSRYKMSKDIIENGRFIGKSKAEIIQLLGQAETSTLTGKEHLVYPLGKAPSFFESKDERLVIIFQNDTVTKVIHNKD